jgi:hypothetical protein
MPDTLPDFLALCKYFLHRIKARFPCRIRA